MEFLTPNRGSDENQSRPAEMPALGGPSAQPLRYLDFLIYEPERSVVLYKGGVPVLVPVPERFAIHKLIVAVERKENSAKATKDIFQASALITALNEKRPLELAEAWTEAWNRGPRWREKLKLGRARLPKVRAPTWTTCSRCREGRPSAARRGLTTVPSSSASSHCCALS